MRQKLLSTIDRRGIEHRLQCIEAIRASMSRSEWGRLRRDAEREMPLWLRLIMWLMIVSVVLMMSAGLGLMVYELGLESEPPSFLNPVFVVSAFATGAALVFGMPMYAVSYNFSRRREIEKRGFCGSCGALLEEIEPDEGDGCVVCKRCGAAWQISGPPTHVGGS